MFKIVFKSAWLTLKIREEISYVSNWAVVIRSVKVRFGIICDISFWKWLSPLSHFLVIVIQTCLLSRFIISDVSFSCNYNVLCLAGNFEIFVIIFCVSRNVFCNLLCLTQYRSNLLCLSGKMGNLVCLTQYSSNFLCLTQYFCNLVFWLNGETVQIFNKHKRDSRNNKSVARDNRDYKYHNSRQLRLPTENIRTAEITPKIVRH